MEDYSYQKAKERALLHARLSQYTNVDALECIINNSSLRLTRIDYLNDKVENLKLVELWQKKIFVSCFTHDMTESVFFWKSYTRNIRNGVRFSLLNSFLQGLSVHPDAKCEKDKLAYCDRSDMQAKFSPNILASTWGIRDYSCVDISYIPRNCNVAELDNFQGRIKYSEWSEELETRLRVAVRPLAFEIAKNNEYYVPEEKYIYVKLPKECIETLEITLSPLATIELRERVNNLLRLNSLMGKVAVKDSVLKGELNENAF